MSRTEQNNSVRKVPFIFSIRFRIIVAFLVPVVCIVILGTSSYRKASSAITDAYTDQTQQTAEVLGQYVTLITDSEKEEFKAYLVEQTLAYYFKDMLERNDALSAKTTYNEKFRDKLTRDSKVSNIYILSDDGKSLMGKTTDLVNDAYTSFAESTEGKIVLDNPYDWHLFGNSPELDSATGMTNSSYAIRWIRKFKDIPQVLVIDLSATEIRDALSILDAGSEGYVALVTSDGREFYSVEDVSSAMFYGQDFYKTAVEGEAESGNKVVKVSGADYLFVYSKLDERGDMIAALIPEDDVLAQTEGIKSLTMVMSIIAIAIAVILALVVTGPMMGTIRYILRKLEMVSRGDLTTHLKPRGKDEFAILCEGINDTVGNVKDLIVSVNEMSGQVGSAAENLADASETFKSTSGEIRDAVEKIENGADRLDINSADCLGQMDTLSTQITEVGTNADEIGKLTGQTSSTIGQGIESVEGLTRSAQATARITKDVIAAIKALEERSKAIHEIVVSINGIAKQTNLLSLNAGIEAARAGEAGRGFTVVAQEIRELSNQCMNSANQISEIVDDIADRTASAVSIASQASDVVETQSIAVEKTKESFKNINNQVKDLIDALQIISENVSVMNASRAETLSSIESISAISTETVACSGEVHSATGTQVEAINNLDEASVQLREKADALIDILASFKIEEDVEA